MPLFSKGDGGNGGGRRESGREGGRQGQGDKLMSKARTLLQSAAAPLTSRHRDRASSNDRPYFDPEQHISEKREWSRRYTQSHAGGRPGGAAAAAAPDRLFEHFAVVGLPPTMNIRAVAADIKTFQRMSREAGGGGASVAAAAGLEVTADTPREERQRQYGLKGPAHQAEVLYSFPSGMPSDLEQGLAAFCFPHGVRPELLERTPSMSALNEVIYSQPYQTHDDHSFVFLMKVASPGSVVPRTLYGVCCYVRELVHRPPSMAREAFPSCNAPLSRYLVVAPRCYCLLTYHPFFALHFRVLQTVLGLERLERMTSFAAELAGLEAGAGWPASSSLASSSVGAASTASISQGGGGGGPGGAASPSATPAGDAAAAGAAAGRAAEEEDASETTSSSSRRWTEGSSVAAAEELLLRPQAPLAGSLAAALQGLSISEHQQAQQQSQEQQQGQQQRPSRMAQVSPHCPGPAASSAGAADDVEVATPTDSQIWLAATTSEGQAAVTPEQASPAAGSGLTPFFTPAGLSSAVGTPGARSVTAQWEQQQPQLEAVLEEPEGSGLLGSGGSIRRALEGSLDLAGGDQAGGNRPGSPDPAAAGVAAAGASPEAGRWHEEELSDGGDNSSSDAESFLTASSSAALLGQQPSAADASPATSAALASALKAHHARRASGASLASVSTAAEASPAPGRPASAAADGAEHAEQGDGGEVQPPLLQLLLDQEPQAAEGLPPLVQLEEDAPAQQQQQKQEEQGGQQQPLIELGEAGPAAGVQQPPLAAQQLEELLQVDGACAEQQQQQDGSRGDGGPGSGVAVRVVTRTFSSPAVRRGGEDLPPRADLLGSSSLFGSARHHTSLQEEESCAAAEAGTGSSGQQQAAEPQGAAQPDVAAQQLQDEASSLQPPQQDDPQQQLLNFEERQDGPQHPQHDPAQHPQQGQAPLELLQEVVRVTAANLDMSRPLRPADLLAVYHASVVPRPGQVFEFQPDPGLQTIAFERPDLAEAARGLGLRPDAACLPDIDAAQNLGGWAVAALCRSMSLDNLITFLTAALLERQIVVFCPNAGLLSGIVLSLVPLLLPFHWQCLLLPVLPAAEGRLELMEAPVPFVLGVLYKTPEVRAKCGSLVRVNVYKDKVKNAGGLPPLPQQAALHDALAGTYAELRKIGLTRTAMTRPVHMISDAQQVLAECFTTTLQKYLRGLVADLRAYCITDVSPSMERTSVLLKDSFVDSFPSRDRPFMRQFAETQMFSVYTDSLLE